MDKLTRNLAIWTIVTNLCIGTGIGHGLSPVFLMEFLLPFMDKQDFHFVLFGYGDNEALSADIIFFVGQVFLLAFLFIKRTSLIFVSLAVLWLGLVSLFYNFGAIMSLFALPFIIVSLFLFGKALKNMNS